MANPGIKLVAPPGQPIDFAAEQQRIALAQAMAQQLLSQGMSEGPPVIHTSPGNPFARDVPNLAPIGKVFQSYFGGKQSERAFADQARLNEAQQARLTSSMEDYMRARLGDEQNKPDIARAIAGAMHSGLPFMQGIAAETVKGMPGGKDYLNYGGTYSKEALGQFGHNPLDPSVLEGRPKVGVHEGIAVGTQDEKVLGTQPVVKYGPSRVDPATGIPGQVQEGTGRVLTQTGGNVTPQVAWENQLSSLDKDTLGKNLEQYQIVRNTMNIVAQTREDIQALPEGKLGALAVPRNFLVKVGEMFGVSDQLPATSTFENLRSVLGNLELANAKRVAPVTKTDLAEIRSIVGDPAMTKRGLIRLMDITEKAAATEGSRIYETTRSIEKRHKMPEDSLTQTYAPDFQTSPPVPAPEPESVTAADGTKYYRSQRSGRVFSTREEALNN